MKLEFSRQIFKKKPSNNKFLENPSSWSMRTDRQTWRS